MTIQSPLRRKIGAIRHDAPPLPSAERVLRRAIVHGLSRGLGLMAEVEKPTRETIQPEKAAALMAEGTLAVLLDGAAGPGVLLLEHGPLAAIIEQTTTGRIGKRVPRARAPSATDAALVADTFDRIFSTHEAMLEELKLSSAVTGFRYAAPLAKARDIVLALPDETHDHWTSRLSFADDEHRRGALHLILPTEAAAAAAMSEGAAGPDWPTRMQSRVMASEVTLEAELGRTTLTAAALRALRVGDRVVLPREQVGKVRLLGPGHVCVATGRLGQATGRKAVRLEPPAEDEDHGFEASGEGSEMGGLLM
ncbi:Type III flagellar switch regulator (C-ring) FliN C-term [Palleronia marisminoris]|uniref:Flagellar motor switch protein FliM n=1 Tax=Palleronia marisminoris TaxID=315423 RepID=A0A1Y5RG06_9RHOB|nr:FliM/FliN family flagellar motor C-terminal domain-containing protein [Palleronia marisminoris]SFG12265.1 Type III flagellar switch regulator (C-ring) FliN C-term [Palleronia marisminoris]SLN13998.1 flagellar motor switch protein FliM [Palleronia marisminoris]